MFKLKGKWRIWQWRRESWRSFWRQRLVWLPVSLMVLFVVLSWWWLWRRLPSQAELSVLRYSVSLGPNWLDNPAWLYLPAALATVTALLNTLLAYTLGRKTLLLKQLWLWSGVVLTFGWWWLVVLLVWINT